MSIHTPPSPPMTRPRLSSCEDKFRGKTLAQAQAEAPALQASLAFLEQQRST